MKIVKKHDLQLLERNKLLIKPHGIIVEVQKKDRLTDPGTTEYTFSYSFKGSMLNNPIYPSQLVSVAQELAKMIKQQKNHILIALDRGGTALGIAVSIISKLPLYIAFSYFTQPPKDWIYWEEKGYGKSLAIPPLPKDTHVILIDDEINTGLTYINAIKTLKGHQVYVDQIIVVAEVKRQKLGREIIKRNFKEVEINSLCLIPEPKFDISFGDYIFPIS